MMPRRAAALTLAIAIGFGLCGVLEWAARALEARQPSSAASVLGWYLPGFAEPDPQLGFLPRPGGPVFFGERINAQRFRGEPVAVPKPPGTYRVLALGGSTTFGWEVAAREAWPAQLEARLRQRCLPALGSRVEVINGGVPAYLAWQNAARLESAWLAYQPDLVIVMDGLNDLLLAGSPFAAMGPARAPARRWREALSRHSALARRMIAQHQAARARAAAGAGGEAALLEAAIRDVEAALDRSDMLLGGRSEALLVVGPPRPAAARAERYLDGAPAVFRTSPPSGAWRHLDALARRLETWATRRTAGYVDLAPVFAAAAQPERLLLEDGIHLSPAGNTLAAEAIFNAYFAGQCAP